MLEAEIYFIYLDCYKSTFKQEYNQCNSSRFIQSTNRACLPSIWLCSNVNQSQSYHLKSYLGRYSLTNGSRRTAASRTELQPPARSEHRNQPKLWKYREKRLVSYIITETAVPRRQNTSSDVTIRPDLEPMHSLNSHRHMQVILGL